MSACESPSEIADLIAGYLAVNPAAVVVEQGGMLFDFACARYQVTPAPTRCLLEIWSEEANIVRRVLRADVRGGILKLEVTRLGQTKPSRLEICPEAERRAPATLKAMRATYQRTLERALAQVCPGWQIERLVTAADLEHSFGAVCARGLLRRGAQQMAIVGCGQGETQATVDSAAATGVLWLDFCRQRYSSAAPVGALAVFVPPGRALAVQLRLSHLDSTAARWRLFTLDEDSGECEELALAGELNFSSHLVRCFDRQQTLARFAESIARLRQLCPRMVAVPLSAELISFRLLGLEFARAILVPDRHFRLIERIRFGPAPAECELTAESEPRLRQLVARLLAGRLARKANDPLYRLQAERWLQAVVERDLSRLDARLDPTQHYAQVPTFAASDRAVLDLLGVTCDRRLAVIELKAAEDLHLPLQGLDYWARVAQHHRRGELRAAGYFPALTLDARDPLLILAAPSLHLHPTTTTLLRYISPTIEWRLVALDEHWRDGIRVVYSHHSHASREPLAARA